MGRSATTWDRLWGKFRGGWKCTGRCRLSCHKGRRLSMELLEERTLLSVTPLSDEQRVNEYTSNTQRLYESGQAVAAMPDGGYVTTWTSENQDGSGMGVYARRFAADGSPLGGEFLVNSTTMLGQQRSSVAGASDGSFVVVWDSYGQDNLVLAGVFGQRYDAQGQAVGGEFQVNQTSLGHQSGPAAACRAGRSTRHSAPAARCGWTSSMAPMDTVTPMQWPSSRTGRS